MRDTRAVSVFADSRDPDFRRNLTGGGFAVEFWNRMTTLAPQWDHLDRDGKLGHIHGQAASFLTLADRQSAGIIHVANITVPMHMRGHGIGTAIMRGLAWHADRENWFLTLDPQRHHLFGHDNGLIRYYKGFGFIQNRGRRKHEQSSAGMIRYPVGWVR